MGKHRQFYTGAMPGAGSNPEENGRAKQLVCGQKVRSIS